MKITRIEPQKKAPGRVNVYVDDEFSFGISDKLLIDFDLYKGKEVEEKEIDKYKEGDSLSKCLDKAYHFLSYRQRSEKEMRDKLLEKYEEKTVEEAIERLKEYNLINDAEFSRMWVEQRGMGRGKRALSFELKRKGIDKDIIEEALEKIDPDKEYESALRLVKGKHKYKNLDRNEAYKKIAPFLSRRGYGYDTIKRVISEIAK
jgi:regulatory protein